MFAADKDTLDKVERQLDQHCPAPESALVRLARLAAELPEDESGGQVRLLVADIDDLIAQARWHLGQVLLLLEIQPHLIVTEPPPEDPLERAVGENIFPTKVMLILRGYIRDADRVVFRDLSEPRRGGTAAGWVYHMMVDNAISRVIGALDRVSLILWHAAALPLRQKNGRRVSVYFRSRKMGEVHNAIGTEDSEKLLGIAGGAVLTYVTDYRDGLAHDFKAYSKAAGIRPTESWTGPDGKEIRVGHAAWDADRLFGLANATYHQLTDALEPTLAICESSWPDAASKAQSA